MTQHPWDDIPRGGGGFKKWNDVGDSVVGTVINVGRGEDLNGNTVPHIGIETDDGDEIIVSASQYDLKEKVLDMRPQVGDRIAIVFTEIEPRPNGKTKKVFQVEVQGGGVSRDTHPTAQAAARPSASDLI